MYYHLLIDGFSFQRFYESCVVGQAINHSRRICFFKCPDPMDLSSLSHFYNGLKRVVTKWIWPKALQTKAAK